jgi:hypothetical protein
MELWRPIADFPGYSVSNLGRVMQTGIGQGRKVGRILTWHTQTSTGYANVRMMRGGKSHGINVHKLVTRAFLGQKPSGMVTRHLDGDKLNNSVNNLRYGTHVENTRDKKAHGTASGWHKLSPQDVLDIRTRTAVGENKKDLALIYGVHYSHVCRIAGNRARTIELDSSNRAIGRAVG